MNHGLNLIVSFFSFVQTSFRELGEAGLGTYSSVYKVFKSWSGSLAKRRLCLGPAGVINCTPRSALHDPRSTIRAPRSALHDPLCASECFPECVATRDSPSVPRTKSDA